MCLFIVLVWCSPEYNVQSFSFRRSQGRNGLKAKMTEQHARNGSTGHASDVWPSRVVIIGLGQKGERQAVAKSIAALICLSLSCLSCVFWFVVSCFNHMGYFRYARSEESTEM